MTLGTRLKNRADELGITQTELAKELGLSTSTLNGYFTDYREPDVKTIARLAEKLNTTTDYLLTGEQKLAHVNSGISDDIGVLLDRLQDKLKAEDTIMFNGYALAQETAEALAASLEIIHKMTVRMSKENQQNRRMHNETGLESPATDPQDELTQKYRQLSPEGQAAVMEVLQKEHDYLYKLIEIPVAARGSGRQVLVTTQADEDLIEKRLAETEPPDDL